MIMDQIPFIYNFNNLQKLYDLNTTWLFKTPSNYWQYTWRLEAFTQKWTATEQGIDQEKQI